MFIIKIYSVNKNKNIQKGEMKLNLLKNIILATNVISSYNSSLMKDEKNLMQTFLLNELIQLIKTI